MFRKKTTALLMSAVVLLAAAAASYAFNSPHTFYDLATDQNVQNNNQFNLYSDMFHGPGGQGSVTVINHNNKKALQLTRTDSYHGLDVKRNGLKINGNFVTGKYTIHILGTIPSSITIPADAYVTINMSEAPHQEVASISVDNDNRNFDLKYEFKRTANGMNTLGYDFRIQARNANTMNIIVTSLVVKVEDAEVYEWPTPKWDTTLASMKDKFAGIFKIGNIMSPGILPNNLHDSYKSAEFFKKHYNVVTLENHMKPSYLMPESGQTKFASADSVVNWAYQNGIEVIGHTLVWHSQSADWLNGGQNKQPLTRAQAKQNLQTYINTVAGHYKGKVTTWDVINEAFMNIGECFEEKGDWKDALRSSPCHRKELNLNVNDHTNSQLSPWYDAYANGADTSNGESGADYIYDAFVFARLADPGAQLYYNDFNEEFYGKREAMALMAEDLNAKWKTDPNNTEPNRLLIEGLGMQSHYYGGPADRYETATYNLAMVDSTIERFVRAGVRISITELDIPMGGWNHKYNEDKLSVSEEALQAKQYEDLMKTYLKYREHIDRITFWGMSDGVSWRFYGMPLLFDNSFRSKAAYDAIMALDLTPTSTLPQNRIVSQKVNKPNLKVSVRRSAVNVKFRAVNSGETVLRLHDLKGNVISSAKLNAVAGKNHTHTFKQKKLPNGFYVVRMQNGNIVEQTRIVSAK